MNNKYLKLTNIINELQYLNYDQIINIITPLTISSLSAIIINKFIIDYTTNKESIYKKYKYHIDKTPNINIKNKIINNHNKFNVSDYYLLKVFINTLENNFNNENLAFLYHNLENLQILSIDDLKKLSRSITNKTMATYDAINNIIYLNKKRNLTIFHELFHVSSSYFDKEKNTIYSGFSQIKKNNFIGKGLTEGYTQYLTEKYFQDNYNLLSSYPYEKGISKNIEYIIGNTNMESLYLNANLLGLINSLNQYNNIDNIYKFIYNIDFIMHYLEQDKISNYATNILIKKLKEINVFLIETYINKILIDYNNISPKESNEKIKKYLSLIPTAITINKQLYSINSIDEIIDISKKKKLIKSN